MRGKGNSGFSFSGDKQRLYLSGGWTSGGRVLVLICPTFFRPDVSKRIYKIGGGQNSAAIFLSSVNVTYIFCKFFLLFY
jgi:hypothetical protein